ncbi:hypothetical protein P280DRAFT_469532 [Massarina eburnea CBS 473.64]|uniref:F-box domain-containing protein n=1 Tax=Massarina eburnea CBS 473.64 TaxID=1395130 RepID=A0A6A6S004_9PLEO|nr:hypothetical protein P280DRAFT_469532 [Massarina eburnea CBS 473.64]
MFSISCNNYFQNREDAQTWRDRLTGKRIVTSVPEIAAYEGWKTKDWTIWEPRIYFCKPISENLGKAIKFEVQEESRLLRLPAELRIRILEYVVPPEMISQKIESTSRRQGDARWKNTSAVIFTCRQLYSEGHTLAVESHTFPYEKFPKKTRLCAQGDWDREYHWDM